MSEQVTVIAADTAARLATAADLFREYAASLPFSLCFQGFEQELATPPGRYGLPGGCLLLTVRREEPLGYVALRAIDALPGRRASAVRAARPRSPRSRLRDDEARHRAGFRGGGGAEHVARLHACTTVQR